MLQELHVHDLALVEDVWLAFGDGLTVLTGETGAGKTVLVEALKLLLGDRADSTLVRTGATEAVVEGRVSVDGVEHVVRRRIGADGRSRCTVDGEMATVGALGSLLEGLVDLHGQHEHQALLSAANHAGYLDRFIGSDALVALEGYREAFHAASAASDRVGYLERAFSDRDRRAEYLRFQIGDIDAVAPHAREDAEIEVVLPRLRHGERLTSAAAGAWANLRDDEGASDRLGRAIGALSAAHGLDPALDAIGEELASALAAIEDIGYRLRAYAESIAHDPRALDEAEMRLATLDALKRKYGPSLDDVLAARETAEAELDSLDAGEAGLAAAREALAVANATRSETAAALWAVREEASPRFVAALGEAARDLALTNARFEVSMTELPPEAWSAEGPARVEFLFSVSAGDAPRPLAKIASGGEISRVMLALKGVLGHADTTPVLVFDEVDAGIGGTTALAVGARLASLAERHQVLVVTHLAQVAARAARHIVVEKVDVDGRAVTRAREVATESRVAEIARMLSGSSSAASVEHARELLDRVALG